MRPIDLIVFHTSAVGPAAAKKQTAADIDRMHKQRGFRKIGYHYFIRFDGTLEIGRPEAEIGAHVEGHNSRSIGVCYAGGLGPDGKPADTRSAAQRATMATLARDLRGRYRNARMCGHRDLSPDLDRDGKVEPHEWLKACPCFDVAAWAKAEGIL